MAASSSTSSSRRFLLRLVLPAGLAIAAGCWLMDQAVWRLLILPARSAGAYKVHRMFTEEDPQEVPILGSSRAAGSYVPELIDPHVYNYGIEKTEHELVEVMLERELQKSRRTPILINWDLEMYRHSIGNVAHFVPNLAHPEVRRYMREELRWYHRFAGVRYFGLYDEYLRAALGERSEGNARSRGGVFDRTPFDAGRFERLVRRREQAEAGWTDPAGRDSTLMALLMRTDRPIVIVVAPYHAACFRNYKGLAEATRYLKRLDALPQVTVLDHGRDPLPDDHFLNTTHVNERGARAFSAVVGAEWRRLFPERQ